MSDTGDEMRTLVFDECRDNKLPIVIFDVLKPGNIHRVLVGEPIGTVVD